MDPGTGSISAHRSHRYVGWRQPLLRIAGALLAAGCGAVLVTRANDGVRTTNSLSSKESIDRAATQNAFYDCLGGQVQRLVPKGAAVAIGTDPDTSQGLSLLIAVIPWAQVAPDASSASVVLKLAPGTGQSSCSGVVVQATPGGGK